MAPGVAGDFRPFDNSARMLIAKIVDAAVVPTTM
jgi:hypothetical protein